MQHDLNTRRVRIPEINHAQSNDTFEYERRHAFLPRDRPRSNTAIRGFHDQPRGRYFHHSQFEPEHRRNISQSKNCSTSCNIQFLNVVAPWKRSSETDNAKLK